MIVTTTDSIEGHRITSYLGVVSSESVLGTNIVKDLVSIFRDVVGGSTTGYEQDFLHAKNRALAELRKRAAMRGANAVVGLDLDYQVIGGDRRTILVVSANGTAVRVEGLAGGNTRPKPISTRSAKKARALRRGRSTSPRIRPKP